MVSPKVMYSVLIMLLLRLFKIIGYASCNSRLALFNPSIVRTNTDICCLDLLLPFTFSCYPSSTTVSVHLTGYTSTVDKTLKGKTALLGSFDYGNVIMIDDVPRQIFI